jgi:hypothetical protein
MAFEIVMYLVAVSLPIWLAVEQVNSRRRAVKRRQGQVESETVPAPASSLAALRTAPRS